MSPRKHREPAEHGEHSLRTHGSSPTGLGVLCRQDRRLPVSDNPTCRICRSLLKLPPIDAPPPTPKTKALPPAPAFVTTALPGFACADGCGRTLTIPHPSGVCRTCRGVPREGDARPYRKHREVLGTPTLAPERSTRSTFNTRFGSGS